MCAAVSVHRRWRQTGILRWEAHLFSFPARKNGLCSRSTYCSPQNIIAFWMAVSDVAIDIVDRVRWTELHLLSKGFLRHLRWKDFIRDMPGLCLSCFLIGYPSTLKNYLSCFMTYKVFWNKFSFHSQTNHILGPYCWNGGCFFTLVGFLIHIANYQGGT